MKFFEKAIDRPMLVTLIAIALAIVCVWAYFRLPVREIPNIQIPYVVVETEYLGAAPEEVESLIAKPLERKISELEDIDNISSVSVRGFSQIYVEFASGKDLDKKVREIQDKLSGIKDDLPESASFPNIKGYKLTDRPALIVLVSGNDNLYDLGKIAENLKDELKQVKGCSYVDMFGDLKREIQVQVDPKMLNSRMISILEVVNALKQQNQDTPGGIMKDGDIGKLVRSIGRFKNIQEIEDTRIRTQYGSIVRIKDIGKVSDGLEEARTNFRINGQRCVALAIYIHEKADLIKTVDMAREKLAQAKSVLPASIQIQTVGDMGSLLRTATGQLWQNALIGSICVIIILIIGLGFRTALMVSLAIPFSILIAIGLLYFFGIDLTGVTIFSLILALGLVVDGAIIVGENIYRHVENGLPPKEAAKVGLHEVAGAILCGDITTIVAYIPMMLMSGPIGQYISVIPKVVAASLAGSIIVDHFIVPTVAARFMKARPKKKSEKVFAPHTKILLKAVKHKWLTVFITASAFTGSLLLIPVMGTELFPKIDTNSVWINIQMPLGSTLQRMDSITHKIEDRIKDVPDVDKYVCSIGMSGLLDTTYGNRPAKSENSAEFLVELKKDKKKKTEEIMADLRQMLSDIPEARITIKQRVEGPPAGSDILVRIKGDDLSVLKELAYNIEGKLNKIKGAADIRTDQEDAQPEIQININHEDASSLGLTVEEISANIAVSINGMVATTFINKDEDVKVRVQYPPSNRKNIEDLFNINFPSIQSLNMTSIDSLLSLSVPTQSGLIPLTQIADIQEVKGISHIYRHNQKRTAQVRCNSEGRLVSKVVRDLQSEIRNSNLPMDYSIEYGGENEETNESFKSLGKVMAMGVIIILLILMAQFKSVLQPIVIMLAVPLSFIGVIIGLVVTGNPFGIMAFIGVVSLAGIVVNDTIVLISYNNSLRESGMDKESAIIQSARTRFRPIILTTLTAIDGVLSIAVGIGGGGNYWAPLSWTIVWGLSTATFLTLIVVPVFYLILEDFRERLMKYRKPQNL